MGIKYQVNEAFFDNWNERMAYVLGYIFADGCIQDVSYMRGKYVAILSTDYDRVSSIRSLMNSKHVIKLERRLEGRKQAFLLRIGSARLFKALIQKGVTPRKSLTMLFPTVPDSYLGPFIRGYFDGDGCVHIDTLHGNPKRLLVVFTSGSKRFLEELHVRLQKEVGILGNGLYNHGSTEGAYQLRYSTRDALRIFELMYPPALDEKLHLSRKYDIFMQYLKLRNIPRDEILLVLCGKGPVAKKQRDGLQNHYARVRIPPGPQI